MSSFISCLSLQFGSETLLQGIHLPWNPNLDKNDVRIEQDLLGEAGYRCNGNVVLSQISIFIHHKKCSNINRYDFVVMYVCIFTNDLNIRGQIAKIFSPADYHVHYNTNLLSYQVLGKNNCVKTTLLLKTIENCKASQVSLLFDIHH